MEAIRNHDPSNVRTNSNAEDSDGEDSTSSSFKTFPITLVLDNLRGSFNVGSIFRTAEACGVSRIITCGITPHPNGSGSEKVAKSALGSEYLVETQYFPTTRLALMELKKNTKMTKKNTKMKTIMRGTRRMKPNAIMNNDCMALHLNIKIRLKYNTLSLFISLHFCYLLHDDFVFDR